MPRGQAGLYLRGLPSPVSPRFPACARTGCEDMSGHGVSPFRSRSVPSARRRRDPYSRVMRAGACALGRAFRAGAVCAPDCPHAPPHANRAQGAPYPLAESGAFFAPARTGKGGGPARMPLPSTPAILPWAMRKSSIEKEIFQKRERRLDSEPARCRNSSSPACPTGFTHPCLPALRCMPPTACPRESGGRPGPRAGVPAPAKEGVTGRERPGPMDGAVAAIAGMNEAGKAMTKLEDLKARFMEDQEFRKEYALVESECRRSSPRCAATQKRPAQG